MHAMDFGIPKDTYTTIFFYLIIKGHSILILNVNLLQQAWLAK